MIQNMNSTKEYPDFLPDIFKEIMERLTHMQKSIEMVMK